MEGEGSSVKLMIINDLYSQKDIAVPEDSALLSWCTGMLAEFGPMMVSMLGRLFHEMFERPFRAHCRQRNETASASEDMTIGISRFLRQYKKIFEVERIKGNESIVQLRDETSRDPTKSLTNDEIICVCRYADRMKRGKSIVEAGVLVVQCFYTSDDILILGDGNLSFSRSLCENLVSKERKTNASNVIATTFDSQMESMHKYGSCEVASNVDAIRRSGGQYHEKVDATSLQPNMFYHNERSTTRNRLFDFIIFQFPHVGKCEDIWESIQANRTLCRKLLLCASSMLKDDGELVGSVHTVCSSFGIPLFRVVSSNQ